MHKKCHGGMEMEREKLLKELEAINEEINAQPAVNAHEMTEMEIKAAMTRLQAIEIRQEEIIKQLGICCEKIHLPQQHALLQDGRTQHQRRLWKQR